MFCPKKKGRLAIILELKVNSTAEDAIAQIKEKNYIQKAEKNSSVLLVGIAYDQAKKVHQCRMEKCAVKGNSIHARNLPI